MRSQRERGKEGDVRIAPGRPAPRAMHITALFTEMGMWQEIKTLEGM